MIDYIKIRYFGSYDQKKTLSINCEREKSFRNIHNIVK